MKMTIPSFFNLKKLNYESMIQQNLINILVGVCFEYI